MSQRRKKELPTYQREVKPTYRIESVKKDINKNLFAEADSLVVNVLSSPRIKFSTSNFLILDGRDSGVSLTEFAQTLKRKNAEVPHIPFTLLDAADITPSLVLNKNANEKEWELGSFQDLRNKNCNCTAKVLQLMVQSKT